MNNQPKFSFENGIARCVLSTKYGTFTGEAKCHPDDFDMESEKVGCEIAYTRAFIVALTHERDNVIKPSLKALKQLLYSMKHSKKFNKKSYENKMLWSQIQNWQFDLNTINKIIANEKEGLRQYIKIKDDLYKRLRAQRNGQN